MDLKEIMSVSGQSGLFRFFSQGRNGIIVESFADKKRSFISASQKVSSLGDIAVFTEGDEVPLKEVLKKIHEAQPGTPVLDPKSSPEKLKAFMEMILPEYDRDRVYVSDIKKLVTWYNTLLELKLLNFDEETTPEAVASKDASVEDKPAAKESKKPAAPKTKKASTTRKTAAAGK